MIYSFGFYYIYRLLRDGPAAATEASPARLPRSPACLAVAMQATPGRGE